MSSSRRAGSIGATGLCKIVFVLILAAGLALVPAFSSPRGRPLHVAAGAGGTLPNVVIVLTDDQRFGTTKRMPELRALIRKKGVTYTDAGAPTSLCCPARTSLLTGLYSHSTRIYSNAKKYGGGWYRFHRRGLEKRTLATALSRAGYTTALVGKYLNGGFENGAGREGYVPPGWDTFTAFVGPMKNHIYDYRLTDGSIHGHRPSDYSTDVLRRKAVHFLRSTPASEPLFLYFAPFSPHRPAIPAPRYAGVWKGKIPSYHPPSIRENVRDKPPWVRKFPVANQKKIDRAIAREQASLNAVDDAVGAIVQALEDEGRMSNTLFVFMTDNGKLLGEHHLFEKKSQPYRWSTRIPLILRWDGRIPPNTTDGRLVVNLDVTTTISQAAGLGMTTEGLDLLAPMRRKGYPLEANRWFPYDAGPRHPAYCGYRTHRWLFVQYTTGFVELYDYKNDPHELTNRAGWSRYADKVRSLRAQARRTCRPVPSAFHW